jgi:hypothetical protein
MEKVLTMMNDPTNSATPAKTSRKVVKKLSPVFSVEALSASSVVPVTASAVAGRTAATAARTVLWATPGAAVRENEGTVSSGANAARAVGSSTRTAVAPNSDPKVTSPVISTVRVWSPITTRVVSPTASLALVRVARSTATSPGPVGPRPLTRVKAGLSAR